MNHNDCDTVLVTGASGQLGRYLIQELMRRQVQTIHAWSGRSTGRVDGMELEPISLNDRDRVMARLEGIKPQVILHAGAISAADDVRKHPEMGRAVNVDGTRHLADWAGENGSRLIYTSTDLVFDGSKAFWSEEDTTGPLLDYGRSKADAEKFVMPLPGGLVARLSLLYGPTLTDRPSFYTATLSAFEKGEPRGLFTDEWRTPLDYLSAAETLCDLALELPHTRGIVHIGGTQRVSRFELISRSAKALGLDLGLVRRALAAETSMPEPRPQDVSLSTDKLQKLLPNRVFRSIEEVAGSIRAF